MPGDAVVGLQWGDEGKGKVVDYLGEKYHAVVRYSGGSNAGHTVYVGDEPLVLHLLPSGILYKGKNNVLGDGMAIDPVLLSGEIKQLKDRGLLNGNLYVSNRAQLTLQHYKAIEEEAEGVLHIGTTRMAIGPTYEFMVNRSGIRTCDLFDEPSLRERLQQNIALSRRLLPDGYELDVDKLIRKLMEDFEGIEEYVTDTSFLINKWLGQGKDVLFEGAQGTHLDLINGTYPHVTSSHPTAGGVSIGAGVGPNRIRNVYGVFKAYPSRVGAGVFPTEMGSIKDVEDVKKDTEVFTGRDKTEMCFGSEKALSKYIRIVAGEYGGTTGRARRIGWPDGVVLLYSKRINGLDKLVITRLDVLDELDRIRLATAYRLNGRVIDEVNEPFPASEAELAKCEPVYEELPGWEQSTAGVTEYENLPGNARRYVERLEELLQLPMNIISTGPRRHETIVR